MKPLGTVATVLLMLTASSALAKGKPGKQITQFEAADVSFPDNVGDWLQSDGLGPYQNGINGVEAHSEYTERAIISANRGAHLMSLGTCIGGDCSALFTTPNVLTDFSLSFFILGHSSELDVDYPAPGETIYSNADEEHHVAFKFTTAEGTRYGLGFKDSTGNVSISAYDFDGDGNSDQNVVNVSGSVTWSLYEEVTETVIVGHGKNQTEEERTGFEWVADYTGMPLSVTFDLLGYRIDRLDP